MINAQERYDDMLPDSYNDDDSAEAYKCFMFAPYYKKLIDANERQIKWFFMDIGMEENEVEDLTSLIYNCACDALAINTYDVINTDKQEELDQEAIDILMNEILGE